MNATYQTELHGLEIEVIVSRRMNLNQTRSIKRTLPLVLGWTVAAALSASLNAHAIPVTVTDVTDWSTTPVEAVNANLPYLGYYGGVYAGINDLAVDNGTSTTVYGGFCIDPFHWSLGGTVSGYSEVSLVDAPKSPAGLDAATAKDIEELWAEYYSPTMSSATAAGLQIAIWELVSSNAVASDGLPANEAFSLAAGQYDYGASLDLASLETYDGPLANLVGLTGPGQDYVIDPPSTPDGGGTLLMLVMAVGALAIARPALMKSAGKLQLRKAEAIPAYPH